MDEASPFYYAPVYDEETANNIKNDFSRLNGECYLDHAGATLYSDSQISSALESLRSSHFANPHSLGLAGTLTHDTIDRVRYSILEYFNASPEEYSVIFTSGATAALKLVAETFRFSNDDKTTGNFVYLQDNHTSVLGMRDLVSSRGANVLCLSHSDAFNLFNSKARSDSTSTSSNSLFVYPAQCNFSGVKYPLSWIHDVQKLDKIAGNSNWFVLVDAAAFASTNKLDLTECNPDFVTVSFYKMFGYPTGLGALIVNNSNFSVLDKVYYGGGTVNFALSSDMYHVKRNVLHERFEDGTVPFLSIISLQQGFDQLKKISTQKISLHVFRLAQYLHHTLLTMHHSNGRPLAKLYSDTDYEDPSVQGGIVSFNVFRSNGEFVGYMEVLNMASLFKINLRTGCHCNPGACQRHLDLSNRELLENYGAGFTCGGDTDLLMGKPTGVVRVSFGYMSSIEDIEVLLGMLKKCFLDGPEVRKVPEWWKDFRFKIEKKFCSSTDEKNEYNGSIIGKLKSIIFDSSVDNSNNVQSVKKNQSLSGKCLELKKMFIYPIKSCAAFEITGSWILGPRGLQYDREWMITNSAGVCMTQKLQVKMCLVKPTISLEDRSLSLSFPGMPPIKVQLSESIDGMLFQSKVCGHRVEGTDCGDEVSEWLSKALNRQNLRLVRQNPNGSDESNLSFSSQAQFLMLNKASINWLIDKIPAEAEFERETVLHRFRGNLVVESDEAFEEFTWKQLKIGKSEFNVKGPCARCQMVCIDQSTGIKTIEPLRTLAEQLHGKMKFGVYLSRQGNDFAVIKIGDRVNYL